MLSICRKLKTCKMNSTSKVLITIALSIGGYYVLNKLFYDGLKKLISCVINNNELSSFLTILIIGLPLFISVLIINKPKFFFESLGLNKSITKASLFALICTLPMLIGYFIIFDYDSSKTWHDVLRGAIIAAFIEELFFRGIFFGQIYRFTQIGFIPSILYGAIIFASFHLYQSQDFLTLIGIFIATFLGAVLFAWAYIEWNNNLWVPIFLHLFMNLFWMLFSAGDNAMGGVYANIFRILTIVLIILLTIVYKKRTGQKLKINRNTLWIKKNWLPQKN